MMTFHRAKKQGAWKSSQHLCSHRDHHQSLLPKTVSVSLWDGAGDGRSPLVPVLAGSAPWLWAGLWALCDLPAFPVLLGCSRSELPPLLTAAPLHIRHAEEPGKDGVIQVHLLVSHLKCSPTSSQLSLLLQVVCHIPVTGLDVAVPEQGEPCWFLPKVLVLQVCHCILIS